MQVRRDQSNQIIAVVHAPGPIDGKHPIPVAVIGEAYVRTGGFDKLDQPLGVGGTAVLIDVPAVGLGARQLEVGTERRQDHRAGAVRRPIRTVEGDPHAGEIQPEGGAQLPDVVVEAALQLAHPADPPSGRLLKASLDRGLRIVIELDPARVEELDAVVGEGIV
jgi:hypothetical protein